jgi:hypothetical protein
VDLDFNRTEPVRANGYAAAGIVAASTLLGAVALLDPVTWQQFAGALGTALAQFATLAFGLERARDTVYSPATHQQDVADAYEQGVRAGFASAANDARLRP